MKLRFLLLLLSALISPPLLVHAQSSASKPSRTITGNVKNEKGEFIVGASVYVKSTPRIGTATDAKGEFRLQGIPSGKQTIVFTFIGMVPFEVEYANQRDLEVVLKEDATQVNEVVVTGIYSRDKNSFAGSATTYTGKELRAIGTKNVFQSLKTLEPALTLVENRAFGSDPNRLPDLEIRGKTSLVGDLTTEYDNTANQPLFILDGIEVEIAQIQNLSMDRIASVTVLKDAASAAIYGSKASNGVIVVETVKPEPGQLRVSYSADLRFEFPDLSDYNLMNAEEKLRYEVLAGRYVGEDQDQLDALYNSRLAEVMRGVDTYWLSVPLRSVLNHTHSVYIDGGSEAMLYGVGLNYSNQKGIMKGSEKGITGGNINLVYRTDKLIFSNDFSFDSVKSEREPVSFSTFAQANPYYRKYSEDGEIPEFLEPYSVAQEFIYNPLYQLRRVVNTDVTKDLGLRNNFTVIWRPVTSLQVRGRLALNKSISEREAFKSPAHSDFNGSTSKGSYTTEKTDLMSYNGDVTVTYGRLFGHHQINAVGGWNFSSRTQKNTGYEIFGFTSDLHQNPSFSEGFQQGDKPSYTDRISRSTSFYLNGNYSYRNRYLFDASLRMDGSSVFGSENLFTTTWAVGVGWNIHNEAWCKAEWLDLLKLRFSIGNPGNQNFDAYTASGTYIYNSTYQNLFGTSAILEKFGNPNLKWQKTIDKNLGLDIDIFDRVKFSVDFYHKNTDPLLAQIPVPPSLGTTRIYTNFGGQISKGFSGSFNVVVMKRQYLRWSVNASFSQNNSEYRNIGDKLDFMNQKGSATTFKRYYDGASPDDIWAVRSHGIDPSSGREVFIRKDGSYTFKYDANDEVVVGSSAPALEGIIGTSIFYKGFSASVNLRYSFGADVFASALYNKVENISETALYYNLDRRALHDRWQKPGDKARFKAISIDDTTPMSSRFVLRENYIAGESISVGYETSARWLHVVGVQGASFRFYMNDIFRLASFKEERGTDYPFSKSFSLSISLRF